MILYIKILGNRCSYCLPLASVLTSMKAFNHLLIAPEGFFKYYIKNVYLYVISIKLIFIKFKYILSFFIRIMDS